LSAFSRSHGNAKNPHECEACTEYQRFSLSVKCHNYGLSFPL
jgi:hypothetical protein